PYSSYYLRLVTVRGQSAFYPLSLHDALPISLPARRQEVQTRIRRVVPPPAGVRTIWMLGIQRRLVRRCEWDTLLPKPGCLPQTSDRKSTRLNSSHVKISYAVFCLTKKNQIWC